MCHSSFINHRKTWLERSFLFFLAIYHEELVLSGILRQKLDSHIYRLHVQTESAWVSEWVAFRSVSKTMFGYTVIVSRKKKKESLPRHVSSFRRKENKIKQLLSFSFYVSLLSYYLLYYIYKYIVYVFALGIFCVTYCLFIFVFIID